MQPFRDCLIGAVQLFRSCQGFASKFFKIRAKKFHRRWRTVETSLASDERSGSSFSFVKLEARMRRDHPLRTIREIANAALSDLSKGFRRKDGDDHKGEGRGRNDASTSRSAPTGRRGVRP